MSDDTRCALDEFAERLKRILSTPDGCKCPKCGDQLHVHYGLAGGGSGPYVICLGCGDIVLKGVEPGGEGEVFNFP